MTFWRDINYFNLTDRIDVKTVRNVKTNKK